MMRLQRSWKRRKQDEDVLNDININKAFCPIFWQNCTVYIFTIFDKRELYIILFTRGANNKSELQDFTAKNVF